MPTAHRTVYQRPLPEGFTFGGFMIDILNIVLAVLSIFPAAFAALLALIGIVGGIKRGTMFTLIRLGVIAVSFVFALLLSLVLLPVLDGVLAGAMTQLLSGFGGLEDLPMEGVAECAGILAGAVLCPFLFCIFYLVIDLVHHIVFHAVASRYYRDTDKTFLSRLGGAAIGLVSALLVSVFLLTPLAGTVTVATTATGSLEEEGYEFPNSETVYEFGEKLTEIPSLALIRSLGGQALYDALAVVRFEDGSHPLPHEIAYVAKTVAYGSRLGTPLIHYNAEQITALRKIAEYCDETGILPHLGGEAISALAAEMSESGSAMSFVLPDFGPYLSDLFDKAFDILATTTPELVSEDLRAMADLLEVMVRYEILISIESDYATLDNLAKPGFAEDLNEVLHAHPRLEPLRDEIGRIALLAIAGAVDVDDFGEVEQTALSSVASEITRLLHETGSEEELADRLNSFLDSADASADIGASGLTNFVASTLMHHFDGKEAVSAGDLEQLIRDYRDELIANGYPV